VVGVPLKKAEEPLLLKFNPGGSVPWYAQLVGVLEAKALSE
jgi:hypothetical protein